MVTLRQSYDPRHNNFDLIRLVLATLVAVSHGIVMHTGTQPQWGESTLGDFAVDGFFVLSGFLVVSSYLRLKSFFRYSWHRLLRIMPAFWVCLLVVGFVAAPAAAFLQGLPISTPFTASPTVFHFLAANAGLLINEYGIGGLLADNPTPFVFIGSLWTLVLEAMCYIALAGLGLIGVLRNRWLVLGLTVVLWALVTAQSLGTAVPLGDNVLRMLLMFFLGASAYLFADLVPAHWSVLVGAVALFLASAVALENYRIAGAAAFAYMLLWLAARLPFKWRLRMDLSYGVFIYHWPLQQLMVLTAAFALPTWAFVVASLALSTLPALASWNLIERPALAQKNWTPPWLSGSRPRVGERVSARDRATAVIGR
ncbi:MAG: acyltransferase [Microlunatus sp.]|nr:acyltransferase [Microlunatus sp.]MDN5771488.1 acyltransferase [Microlunatus sp.]